MPRVKHYFEKGRFYHITTRTEGGVHAFASDSAKEVIVAALSFYRNRGDWKLFGFVVMANHVHFVVSETGVGLGGVVGNFKKWIWGQLAGPQPGRLWERRYDDNAIAGAEEMKNVIRYMHNNPVRIGLVRTAEDYFWSSARNHAGLSPVAAEVDMQW